MHVVGCCQVFRIDGTQFRDDKARQLMMKVWM